MAIEHPHFSSRLIGFDEYERMRTGKTGLRATKEHIYGEDGHALFEAIATNDLLRRRGQALSFDVQLSATSTSQPEDFPILNMTITDRFLALTGLLKVQPYLRTDLSPEVPAGSISWEIYTDSLQELTDRSIGSVHQGFFMVGMSDASIEELIAKG